MLSTAQLAQGGPDNVIVHLTLRLLQALQATCARLWGLPLFDGIAQVIYYPDSPKVNDSGDLNSA